MKFGLQTSLMSPLTCKYFGVWCAFAVFSTSAHAQVFWSNAGDINDLTALANAPESHAIPVRGRAVIFDVDALRLSLGSTAKASLSKRVLTLPDPKGASRDFVVERSGVLPRSLEARFPNLMVFRGFAQDDPTVTIRFEVDGDGISAQVLEPGTRWVIDSYPEIQSGLAISYYSGGNKRSAANRFCEFESEGASVKSQRDLVTHDSTAKRAAKGSGAQLRTYRLAVATTGEYGQYHGAEVESVLSAVTTTINRVVGILEKEMSISLVLVENNDQILFTDPLTDPFTGNNSPSVLIEESQTQIDLIIGTENYDVGHTFSTGAGGLASLGSVCNSTSKARGVTGSDLPSGDYFDVDFVAHELGHQFGGNHTYNGISQGCSTLQRNASTAFEPGSGSTIMAYPNLCGSDNLQNAVDPIFHSASFEEIYDFVSEGAGATCGVVEDAGNTPPSVNAGDDFHVPFGTPLVLSGSGEDVEQASISFLWEQRDLGDQAALSAPDDGEIPLFRVLTPSASPIRYLPALSSVIAGNYASDEKIPQLARDMDFRLSARDGVGGVSSDDLVINVSGSAGPFALSSPNGGDRVYETATITWDVAKTDEAPVSTDRVEMLLSINGGVSFDISLGTTANDGNETVLLPAGIKTTKARLQIKAVDNIYYDVSDGDFVVDSDRVIPPAPIRTQVVPASNGAVVTFLAGDDNGVEVTNYVTSCVTKPRSYSASPALAFNELSPVTSTISVTTPFTIESGDVIVPVDISHTWRGDVGISLTSPIGTSVILKTAMQTDSGQDVKGTYPDTLTPQQSLELFAGEEAFGIWTLDVNDAYNQDSGRLNSWGLIFTLPTTGTVVTASDISSPIYLEGMSNDETYECSITAYAGEEASETILIGDVTPSEGAPGLPVWMKFIADQSRASASQSGKDL